MGGEAEDVGEEGGQVSLAANEVEAVGAVDLLEGREEAPVRRRPPDPLDHQALEGALLEGAFESRLSVELEELVGAE